MDVVDDEGGNDADTDAVVARQHTAAAATAVVAVIPFMVAAPVVFMLDNKMNEWGGPFFMMSFASSKWNEQIIIADFIL